MTRVVHASGTAPAPPPAAVGRHRRARSASSTQPLDLMAQVLLAVWAGGTATYTAGLALAPPPQASLAALWSVTAAAGGFIAGLWLLRRRLAPWAADVSGVACSVLTSTVVVASRDISTPAPLFYLWVIVASCYFVPPARAAGQVLVVAVSYAAALVAGSGPYEWDRWALLSLTAVAVGSTVAALRARELALVARLAEAARTDPLTGLLNRRGFDGALQKELDRADRGGAPVALIMGDLDRFKAVNDLLGHVGGDAVLRQVAAILQAAVRSVDVVARLGGEEFAVICPSCSAADARRLAERIRAAIGDLPVPADAVLTISLGVAVYPEQATDSASLVRAADDACYTAKRLGRDRTVLAANRHH